MAIRDKMRANAFPLLQPDEEVQALIGAQTKSQWLALITYWILAFTNGYRVIVVTDRRILVTKSGRMSMTPVKEIVGELPRGTKIGPASGLWYKCDSLGERLYIHKRFHKDVAAADSMTVS
jgi:Bacterial PH domain